MGPDTNQWVNKYGRFYLRSVETAYARSDLFKRRRLMDEWTPYLAQGTGEDTELFR